MKKKPRFALIVISMKYLLRALSSINTHQECSTTQGIYKQTIPKSSLNALQTYTNV